MWFFTFIPLPSWRQKLEKNETNNIIPILVGGYAGTCFRSEKSAHVLSQVLTGTIFRKLIIYKQFR